MEITFFIFLLFALVFYFLPAIICTTRKANHSDAIVLVNLFLGWTVLGWIAALVWAVAETPNCPTRPSFFSG